MPEHISRFVKFGTVGGSVFVLSFALVYLFVTVLGAHPAVGYGTSAAIAICVSFVLNRRFTWHDSSVGLWESAWKFAASRIATAIGLETLLFMLLVHAGTQAQLAQVGAVAVATVANYILSHLSFTDNDELAVVVAELPQAYPEFASAA